MIHVAIRRTAANTPLLALLTFMTFCYTVYLKISIIMSGEAEVFQYIIYCWLKYTLKDILHKCAARVRS